MLGSLLPSQPEHIPTCLTSLLHSAQSWPIIAVSHMMAILIIFAITFSLFIIAYFASDLLYAIMAKLQLPRKTPEYMSYHRNKP